MSRRLHTGPGRSDLWNHGNCETQFDFEPSVRRIYESARVRSRIPRKHSLFLSVNVEAVPAECAQTEKLPALRNDIETQGTIGYRMRMSDGHLGERAARAQKIVEAPGNFKVCEGCDSIVARHVATCPNCHGYRFNCDEDEIVAHARLLASRPQTSVTESDMY
jgi:hypothetical protein